MAQVFLRSFQIQNLLKLNGGFLSVRTLTSKTAEAYYDDDQKQMQKTLLRIIDDDINPNVDHWEKEGQYPAHQVFKKLGDAGLLGIDKVLSKKLLMQSNFYLRLSQRKSKII
jgi:Acyl-CoA dehydrogenase, N-terminal domain